MYFTLGIWGQLAQVLLNARMDQYVRLKVMFSTLRESISYILSLPLTLFPLSAPSHPLLAAPTLRQWWHVSRS